MDDIETNRNLIKEYLLSFDFHILEAANGREAVELAQQNTPDLILMDMKMPVMNGYEATQQIKKNPKTQTIPVIALTASAMKGAEEEFTKVCDAYLRKPIAQTQLLDKLTGFLKHTRKEKHVTEMNTIPGKEEKVLDSIPDAEALAKFPGLVAILEEEMKAWEQMSEALLVQEIQPFSIRMRDLGKKHRYPPLETWGKELHSQASVFDIAALPGTLERFPELIKTIRLLIQNST